VGRIPPPGHRVRAGPLPRRALSAGRCRQLAITAAIGVVGAAAGPGRGFAGAAIIAAIAPKLNATADQNGLSQAGRPPSGSPPGSHAILVGGGNLIHTVPIPLNPSVGAGVIMLAVAVAVALALALALALAGGLLAGTFATWRVAVPRPADALARVA
jgi:putative ABC transport system permease protein